ADASPTALSPGYVADSDLDEDPDEDPGEDHADYPADGGDGDDEPSDDDDDDDDDTNDEDEEPFEDEDDDEKEEHLAPANSFSIPIVDPVPSAGDTEAFVKRLPALPIPPPSPVSPWSSPLPQIPSPPLPPPPSSLHLPPPVHTSLLLPSSLLPSLPTSLSVPPPVDSREDTPEAELPPCKRLCMTTPTSRNEVGESSTAAPRPTGGHRADYGFIDTIDAEISESRGVGLRLAVHYELQAYRTHTQMQDYRIASQESLRATMTAQVSLLQGQLSMALGQIQALQARDLTHADDPEGAGSSSQNNMPPSRTSAATARAAVAATRAAAAAAPLTVAAVEQLIEARGTEGVVVLSQWFEKMESVFHISNCAVENQVKFATCTFLGNALTWWNSHMKTVTQDVPYAMDWKALKKMMRVKYYPRGEIKKLEIKLWNLKVKGTNVKSYTLRFQELALMCGRMFHEESEEVEKYVGGLSDMIRGNVMSYQPKTMEKAIDFANDQMDKKVLTITERQAEQKRKGSTRDHCPYVQNATITTKVHVLPGVISARRSVIWLVTKGVLVLTGNFKKDCPKLKNGNRGNQCGNGNAPAKVDVVGNAGTNSDSN
ncbi:putative reverse transcriptase domain-containing protein, partial [Tanacetum coccineum]